MSDQGRGREGGPLCAGAMADGGTYALEAVWRARGMGSEGPTAFHLPSGATLVLFTYGEKSFGDNFQDAEKQKKELVSQSLDAARDAILYCNQVDARKNFPSATRIPGAEHGAKVQHYDEPARQVVLVRGWHATGTAVQNARKNTGCVPIAEWEGAHFPFPLSRDDVYAHEKRAHVWVIGSTLRLAFMCLVDPSEFVARGVRAGEPLYYALDGVAKPDYTDGMKKARDVVERLTTEMGELELGEGNAAEKTMLADRLRDAEADADYRDYLTLKADLELSERDLFDAEQGVAKEVDLYVVRAYEAHARRTQKKKKKKKGPADASSPLAARRTRYAWTPLQAHPNMEFLERPQTAIFTGQAHVLPQAGSRIYATFQLLLRDEYGRQLAGSAADTTSRYAKSVDGVRLIGWHTDAPKIHPPVTVQAPAWEGIPPWRGSVAVTSPVTCYPRTSLPLTIILPALRRCRHVGAAVAHAWIRWCFENFASTLDLRVGEGVAELQRQLDVILAAVVPSGDAAAEDLRRGVAAAVGLACQAAGFFCGGAAAAAWLYASLTTEAVEHATALARSVDEPPGEFFPRALIALHASGRVTSDQWREFGRNLLTVPHVKDFFSAVAQLHHALDLFAPSLRLLAGRAFYVAETHDFNAAWDAATTYVVMRRAALTLPLLLVPVRPNTPGDAEILAGVIAGSRARAGSLARPPVMQIVINPDAVQPDDDDERAAAGGEWRWWRKVQGSRERYAFAYLLPVDDDHETSWHRSIDVYIRWHAPGGRGTTSLSRELAGWTTEVRLDNENLHAMAQDALALAQQTMRDVWDRSLDFPPPKIPGRYEAHDAPPLSWSTFVSYGDESTEELPTTDVCLACSTRGMSPTVGETNGKVVWSVNAYVLTAYGALCYEAGERDEADIFYAAVAGRKIRGARVGFCEAHMKQLVCPFYWCRSCALEMRAFQEQLYEKYRNVIRTMHYYDASEKKLKNLSVRPPERELMRARKALGGPRYFPHGSFRVEEAELAPPTFPPYLQIMTRTVDSATESATDKFAVKRCKDECAAARRLQQATFDEIVASWSDKAKMYNAAEAEKLPPPGGGPPPR